MAIFLSRIPLKIKDSSDGRGFPLTNQDGDNIQKDLFLTAKQNLLENF